MAPSTLEEPAPSAVSGKDRIDPRATALLLALVAALLLFRLGAVPLLGPDEPRYARVAVEMHRAHEPVRPTLQGQPWLEKPALYYWLAGAAYGLFGENEAAARLPSVLAAVLLVWVTLGVGRRLYGPRAGLHAGFILGTSLLTFVYGRAAAMDMLLAAGVTAGIGLLGLDLLRVPGRGRVPIAFACLGLATLAKGPIGFLLPGLVVVAYMAFAREWRRSLTRLLSPGGLLVFLVVTAPWYVAIYRDQGREFLRVFILNHNIERFTTTIHHHPGSVLYYVPVLVLGLLPWSGLLVPALSGVRPRRSRADLYVICWALLPLAFFSSAGSKLPGYILPCLAPLALLMGKAADALGRGEAPPWSARATARVELALGLIAAGIPVVLALRRDPAWILVAPPALWTLIVTATIWRRLLPDPEAAFRLLRVGAAGLLLLLATSLPPILAARDSGRDLFLPARGREVLVWGAWRTAWMAGYFYNDGRVRPVADLAAVLEEAEDGPALVLCGPAERRQIEGAASLKSRVLARGPRRNVLLSVRRSSAGGAPEPSPMPQRG